jgi:hypothetical protein
MITTKQVRAIMRKHNPQWAVIYTNITRKNPGMLRSVKCYYGSNDQLLNALRRAAGKDNVNLTKGSYYGPAITVKCQLA